MMKSIFGASQTISSRDGVAESLLHWGTRSWSTYLMLNTRIAYRPERSHKECGISHI